MESKPKFKKILAAWVCLMINLGAGTAYNSSDSPDKNSDIRIQNKISPERVFRSYFINKGFINGKIEIPELEVEVTLKENQFLKKEENVVDVCGRIKTIRKQFGLPDQESDCVQGYGWCGFLNAECLGKVAYGYIILIRKNLNEVSRVYTVGHESGHFMWYINQQEVIYQKFKDPNLVRTQIHSNCDFAVLCGWVAVKVAGYNLNDCLIINIHNPEREKRSDCLKNLVRDYLREKEKNRKK